MCTHVRARAAPMTTHSEAILEEYQQEEAQKEAPVIEEEVAPPMKKRPRHFKVNKGRLSTNPPRAPRL